MKIIKRNGSEVTFDVEKIVAAITKANNVVPADHRLTAEQVRRIATKVEDACATCGHTVSVEEVQDMVEDQIMAACAYEVARHYITYRYIQGLKRQRNTTDDKILVADRVQQRGGQAGELQQEPHRELGAARLHGRRGLQGPHAPHAAAPRDRARPTTRASSTSTTPTTIAQHMHNCDLVNLEDMLQNGTVISGTLIERPAQLLHRLQHRHADHRAGGLAASTAASPSR